MSILRDRKVETVKEINEKISKSKSVVVATYQGLTVKQIQQLRKEAKAKDVEIKVYKNRLVKKALETTEFKDLSTTLVGANLYAFSYSDYLNAPKVLNEFAKKHKQVQFVSGIVENAVTSKEEIIEIASLPSYEEALTILANSLLTPVKQVAIGLKMLVDENHIKSE